MNWFDVTIQLPVETRQSLLNHPVDHSITKILLGLELLTTTYRARLQTILSRIANSQYYGYFLSHQIPREYSIFVSVAQWNLFQS